MTTNAPNTVELEFANLDFYQGYVISTIKEGTIVEEEQLDELIAACKNQYGERAFVYISNRKFEYNVNPLIYLSLFKIENLQGLAMVSSSSAGLKTANFEKYFSRVPYEIFQQLEEAKTWAKSLL